MDTDINDIWDLPLKNPVNNSDDGDRWPSTPSPRPSNPPLFLPSSDEEDDAARSNATTANDGTNNPDIDALFEGLDDIDDSFQELAPALDIAALRREADARNARAVRAELGTAAAESSTAAAAATAKSKNNGGRGGVLDGLDGDGEDDGKKKRKPLPKLDETRLLGKDGFPQLLKDTKNFKPKGKGHEATDLDRVLQIYQFWSHKLYPKTRFKETVDRVEKLCHSKRMQVALSVWHDEAKGLVNGVRLPTADDENDSDDDSQVDDDAPRDNETERAAEAAATATSSTSRPSSPARSRLRRGGGEISTTSDSDGDIDDAPRVSSDDALRPPSSSPDGDRDRDEAAAIELDALFEAEPSHNVTSTTGHAWKGTSKGDDAIAMDEDEDLWDALDTDTGAVGVAASSAPATATTTTPAPPAMDDDDQEMWDIMHELEQEKKEKETVVHRPDPVQVLPPPPPPPAAGASGTQPETETDDLDDLYL